MICFLSNHADGYRIYFYEGSTATVDADEDIILRFAYDDSVNNGYGVRGWQLFTKSEISRNLYQVVYDFPSSFKINTSFPYHAELHIKNTQFNYEGEYFLLIIDNDASYHLLRPNFLIDVNSKCKK